MFQMTDWGRHADPRGAGEPRAHPLLWYSPYREVCICICICICICTHCYDTQLTKRFTFLIFQYGFSICLAIVFQHRYMDFWFVLQFMSFQMNIGVFEYFWTQNAIHHLIVHEMYQSLKKKFHDEMTYSTRRWHSTAPLSTLITTKGTNVMCETAHAMSYVTQCHMSKSYF